MGTLKTTNIQTITGSGTLTLGTSGETFALGSGVTLGSGFNFTLGTKVTASGTSVDFTGIPSTARMIVLNYEDLSYSGSGNTDLVLLLGDSGGVEASSYKATNVYLSTNTAEASPGGTGSTTRFGLAYQPSPSNVNHGQAILTCKDPSTNTWNLAGLGSSYSAGYIQAFAGVKSLSGTLDRVQIKWANGNSFDGGTVNIMYI